MPQELLDIGFAHERSTGAEDWLTPPRILKALGEFDLDPCAAVNQPWRTAKVQYTIHDNGLLKPWSGRCWVNPPYGNQTAKWMRKLAQHGNGIALIFARTETKIFFPWVWEYADALLFLKGRVRFYTKEGREGGSAGSPSVLVAYSAENAATLENCGLAGHLVFNTRKSIDTACDSR